MSTPTSTTLQRQGLQAKAFQAAAALFNRLQAGLNAMMPPPMRLLQIGSAFWQSRALAVAAQLDLATALGDDRLTPSALAARVGIDADACHRLLRFLAAMGVFTLGRDGRVANNPASHALRSDRPGSVRHVVLMHNSPEMSRPWFEALEPAVRTGAVPFELVHGQPLYAHMDRHPDFDALFARAMDEVGALGGDSFATAFDWGRFERVIDLGGGKGAKTAAILQHHPRLHAVVMDRPGVMAQAHTWWQAPPRQALSARVQFCEGDLLHDALPLAQQGDVYLLSAVLHGCDDPTATRMLRRVREAVGASSALVVLMEVVVPEHDVDLATAGFDMQMFMGTRGRERTLAEYGALAQASGLAVREVVRMAAMGSLVVLEAGEIPS